MKQFASEKISTSGADIQVFHAGKGPALFLLHGYPQTHYMWHRIAPTLANHFHVICPDLRGYGDSSKPPSGQDFANYSKRAMAQDILEIAEQLGYSEFSLVGHDRGARVAHRLMLDHPEVVTQACAMDIVPTAYMFAHTDQAFATGYYHWFFLIQTGGLPEQMIKNNSDYYVTEKLQRWSGPGARFAAEALAEYKRCFADPETVRATCDDYRAAASIDLRHDSEDSGRKIATPLLVLWGKHSFIEKTYDVLSVWENYATRVTGCGIASGHFVAEEAPDQVLVHLGDFLGFRP